ncbi:hypothetical protein CAPTEDRAFT_119493 [Capitella teleta]|uniref:Choline/ethanolamine transporter FLVCR1 n=1 Tax=Capitella teleta TaxID=283909 RepID=R7TDZ5_CAPTE|nr:hypothetical protein CAPTEDRAFT_119493 [Capitella teleta]|eukprot:ELT91732.1 hypothetical protein CAPTEDRAFT_119493 [Capitella teleta]
MEDKPRVVPRLYKRRWIMVLLFATYSLSNAYQWIHLNIIGDIVHKYYNASMPGNEYQQLLALDWLSMIYMLAYIPLIFPATWLLDKKGLRLCGLLATFLNALGAWIKCGAISSDRFGVLMAGQTICAIAQIFVLGIPARLAAVWFGPNEVSTATAIGVFGNQIGCALGFLIPPQIVPYSDDLDFIGKRLSIMFYGGAAFMTLLFIIVFFVFKNGPPVPPSQAQACAVEHAAQEDYSASLLRLIRHKGFIILMITYGANTGSYYAIGTLLNPIVLNYFPGDNENAGLIGLTLVVAGVAGSILAGLWLDKTKLYKWTTVGIYFMSFAGMIFFTFTLSLGKIWVVFVCSGALGFFMTGYLPVGFEFAAELTFPEPEGTSSGLLNASAQTFGIVLTLGLRALSDVYGMLPATITISAALLLGTICTGGSSRLNNSHPILILYLFCQA